MLTTTVLTPAVDRAPSFEEMRRIARRLLAAARDELSADWRPGSGPTTAQAAAAQEALRHMSRALAALDQAAGGR